MTPRTDVARCSLAVREGVQQLALRIRQRQSNAHRAVPNPHVQRQVAPLFATIHRRDLQKIASLPDALLRCQWQGVAFQSCPTDPAEFALAYAERLNRHHHEPSCARRKAAITLLVTHFLFCCKSVQGPGPVHQLRISNSRTSRSVGHPLELALLYHLVGRGFAGLQDPVMAFPDPGAPGRPRGWRSTLADGLASLYQAPVPIPRIERRLRANERRIAHELGLQSTEAPTLHPDIKEAARALAQGPSPGQGSPTAPPHHVPPYVRQVLAASSTAFLAGLYFLAGAPPPSELSPAPQSALRPRGGEPAQQLLLRSGSHLVSEGRVHAQAPLNIQIPSATHPWHLTIHGPGSPVNTWLHPPDARAEVVLETPGEWILTACPTAPSPGSEQDNCLQTRVTAW